MDSKQVNVDAADLADDLAMVRDDLAAEAGEGEDACVDVRLQVYPSGDWHVRVGDPGWDLDHAGTWGASSVGSGDTDEDLAATARDLIDQVADALAEQA